LLREPAPGATTIARMPIYEFRCEECGAEFEELVKAGSNATACPSCGSKRVKRTFSAQAAPFGLVKTPGEARKQERRNAQLRQATKSRFKQARQRAREQRRSGSGGTS
jgi:putative FmdB family regulatory protein